MRSRVKDLAAANTFEIRIRQSSGNRSIGYRITGQKLPVWAEKGFAIAHPGFTAEIRASGRGSHLWCTSVQYGFILRSRKILASKSQTVAYGEFINLSDLMEALTAYRLR